MEHKRTEYNLADQRRNRAQRFVQGLRMSVRRKKAETGHGDADRNPGIVQGRVLRAPTGARNRVTGLFKLFAALLVVCAIAYLGLASRDGTLSRIARVPNLDATPGGARQRESPQYQDTLRRANDLNLERAMVEGGSFVMVPEVVPEQISLKSATGTSIQGSAGQAHAHSNQPLRRAVDASKEDTLTVSASADTQPGSTTNISAILPADTSQPGAASNASDSDREERQGEPFSIAAITQAAVSTPRTAGTGSSSSISVADANAVTRLSEKDVSALQQRMLAQMNAIAASIVVGPAASRILITDEDKLPQGSASQDFQPPLLVDPVGFEANEGGIGASPGAFPPDQSQPDEARRNAGQTVSSAVEGSTFGLAVPETIAAGTILYGEVLNEVSSDLSVPILATISTGPMSGWRLVGQFAVADDNSGLIVEFDQLVDPEGQTLSVEAMAIDGYEGQSIISSKIDRRLLARYGPALAASFVNGLAQSAAQPRMSISSVGNAAVLVTDQASFRQSLYSGLESATSLLASDLTANRPTGPRIVLSAGYPLGILFTDSARLNSRN